MRQARDWYKTTKTHSRRLRSLKNQKEKKTIIEDSLTTSEQEKMFSEHCQIKHGWAKFAL